AGQPRLFRQPLPLHPVPSGGHLLPPHRPGQIRRPRPLPERDGPPARRREAGPALLFCRPVLRPCVEQILRQKGGQGMSEVLLSVIVPVYNAAATLEKCAASVLGQAPEAAELILVDDGSADSSPA